MKGHALRGLFGGFFFGLFLGITLWIFGVIPFHSELLWVMPLVFLVVGLALAAWAPFGSGTSGEAATAETVTYGEAGDAERYEPSGTTLEQEAVPPPEVDDDTPKDA